MNAFGYALAGAMASGGSAYSSIISERELERLRIMREESLAKIRNTYARENIELQNRLASEREEKAYQRSPSGLMSKGRPLTREQLANLPEDAETMTEYEAQQQTAAKYRRPERVPFNERIFNSMSPEQQEEYKKSLIGGKPSFNEMLWSQMSEEQRKKVLDRFSEGGVSSSPIFPKGGLTQKQMVDGQQKLRSEYNEAMAYTPDDERISLKEWALENQPEAYRTYFGSDEEERQGPTKEQALDAFKTAAPEKRQEIINQAASVLNEEDGRWFVDQAKQFLASEKPKEKKGLMQKAKKEPEKKKSSEYRSWIDFFREASRAAKDNKTWEEYLAR